MKREGLTITMIFLAESANYGEGIGNISSLKNLCSKDCPSHQIQNRTHPLRHVLSQSETGVFPFVRFRLNTAYQPLIFHSFQHRSKRCYS